ncbi:MAG: hypothetical protein MJZ15_06110 [Bacteroidales bacterium]|nr:hypothetical protein [Bacteroidales bacterium]
MYNTQPTFTYCLREPGQAVASLKVNDDEVDFELTNVSNPLGDLLEGLVTMITTPSQMWGEENVCRVIWYGESSTYNWTISHVDESHCNISIAESVDFFGDDTESELIEFDCSFLDFIHAVIVELDKFIKAMGLLNYSQMWQKDEFPITQFLFLKKTLIDNGKWDDTPSADNHKNVLSDECLMLLA